MAKLRRPNKGSIHEIPLYDGVDPHEPSEAAAEIYERLQEDETDGPFAAQVFSAAELRVVIEDIETKHGQPQAVAITTNEELAGVTVGLVYLGPKKAQSWQMQQTGLKLQDAKRLGAHRKDHKREHVPELYKENTLTPEGVRSYQELIADVFAHGVAYVEGVEGIERADYEAKKGNETELERFRAEVVDFLQELDFGEQLKLMARVISLQSLRRSQTFPSARARVLEADAAPAA